jgi:hypothetical protein
MSSPETRPMTHRSALRLEDDDVCVFDRNGVYQARIRQGNGRYIWRSLKTADEQQAISAALRLHHSLEFRKQNGLPLSSRKFEQVISEYVAFRERIDEFSQALTWLALHERANGKQSVA